MNMAKPAEIRPRPRAQRIAGAVAVQVVDGVPIPDCVETAEYVAKMSAELADLAGAARLDMLAYFLNLARLEAESHCPRRK